VSGHQNSILIHVEHLSKGFPIRRGIVFRHQVGSIQAVEDVTFDIYQGETLGLVGESGCGKTTLGRTIIQLYQATQGRIYYREQELTAMHGEELRHFRRNMQMVFQDPYASLNPRMMVGSILAEPLVVHQIGNHQERLVRIQELLKLVGLNPYFANRYPHEFSGGQRQRICIARALALQPQFIICDEPIAALDVSIQAQVVNLLQDLQEQYHLTYLFIAHDLSMVRHISHRIAVMYLGKIVELANRDEIYDHAAHPYTQALLSAVPIPDPVKERERKRIILEGDVPSPANPPSGCRFHPRCPIAMEICKHEAPLWREITAGHWVACHMA